MFEGLAKRIQNVFAPFGSKGLLKQEDIDQFLRTCDGFLSRLMLVYRWS